jgi:hypothetical protein
MVVGMAVVQFDLECVVAFSRKGIGIRKGHMEELGAEPFLIDIKTFRLLPFAAKLAVTRFTHVFGICNTQVPKHDFSTTAAHITMII